MANLEEEKILNDEPDFETQKKILQEEREKTKKNAKWRASVGFTLLFVVVIVLTISLLLKVYIPYDKELIHGTFNAPLASDDVCLNVNLKANDSSIYNINVTDGDNCFPVFNIDYYNNRIALFNIDVLGDKSVIFNAMNQRNENNLCYLNCDVDEDGWPDLNIDLNGDKIADINISNEGRYCDINCDVNFDMIPDNNIDLNDDGVADINIDNDHDGIPDLNINYLGNKEAIFNIDTNADGIADKNVLNEISSLGTCIKNCDINGDRLPDYNIDLGVGFLINELIETGTKKAEFKFGIVDDIKCNLNKECVGKKNTFDNIYINIDVNGDGIPDVNLSKDNGVTITNKVNKNYKNKIFNEDINKDGFPDINIDLDGDNVADLNVTNKKGECIKNCDINGDGKIDIKENINNYYYTNIDKDYDSICDYNCNNGFNVDINSDTIPDFYIDADYDGACDENCVTTMVENFSKPDDHTIVFDVDTSSSGEVYYVSNSLKVFEKNIKPGVKYNYRLIVNNKTDKGIKYNMKWTSINNTFVEGDNINYLIKRDYKNYIDFIEAPREDSIIKENLLLAPHSSYIYDIQLVYNGVSEELHNFKGTIDIEIIK